MDLDRMRLDFWDAVENKVVSFCGKRKRKIYVERLDEARECWYQREVQKKIERGW